MLGTDIIKRCDLTGGQVIEPTPDRSERVLIREDLGGLLQGLVLVDRNEHRGRSTVPSDRDMLTTVSDLVEQIGEVGTELPDGNGLRHTGECTSLCTQEAAGLTGFDDSDDASRALFLDVSTVQQRPLNGCSGCASTTSRTSSCRRRSINRCLPCRPGCQPDREHVASQGAEPMLLLQVPMQTVDLISDTIGRSYSLRWHGR